MKVNECARSDALAHVATISIAGVRNDEVAHASWLACFGRVRVLVRLFKQHCPLRSYTALVCAHVRRVFLVVLVPFLVIKGI